MHHYIHLSQNSITKAINNLQEKKNLFPYQTSEFKMEKLQEYRKRLNLQI